MLPKTIHLIGFQKNCNLKNETYGSGYAEHTYHAVYREVEGVGEEGRVVSDRMAPAGATGSLYHQKALIKYTHSIYILIYDEALVVNTP